MRLASPSGAPARRIGCTEEDADDGRVAASRCESLQSAEAIEVAPSFAFRAPTVQPPEPKPPPSHRAIAQIAAMFPDASPDEVAAKLADYCPSSRIAEELTSEIVAAISEQRSTRASR